jgi:hypothetical protein
MQCRGSPDIAGLAPCRLRFARSGHEDDLAPRVALLELLVRLANIRHRGRGAREVEGELTESMRGRHAPELVITGPLTERRTRRASCSKSRSLRVGRRALLRRR